MWWLFVHHLCGSCEMGIACIKTCNFVYIFIMIRKLPRIEVYLYVIEICMWEKCCLKLIPNSLFKLTKITFFFFIFQSSVS